MDVTFINSFSGQYIDEIEKLLRANAWRWVTEFQVSGVHRNA